MTVIIATAVIIDVVQKRVSPKQAAVRYRHSGHSGDPDVPHIIKWQVEGLQPGERVEIELREITELRGHPEHDEILHSLFTDEYDNTRKYFSWTIPYGTSQLESGHAELSVKAPTTPDGEFTRTYDVRWVNANGVSETLDPGIRVTPDP